jgi:3-oxoacyl-[acyl-carrier protein] reductase
MRFDEQTVLVTGGGRGLGASIAAAFAGQGARVVIDYRTSKEAAEALANRLGDRAFAVQGDVTDESAVATLFDTARAHFGTPITTVVNNALADFSFDGDARPKADTITWDRFDAQLRGSVARPASVESSTWAPTCSRILWCRTTTTRRPRPHCSR